MSTTSAGLTEGRLAIVTGAAQGIGAATARLLAEEGAKVMLGDLDERGAEVADALRAEGHDVWFEQLDVTSQDSWANIVARAESLSGLTTTILVNNAGIIHLRAPDEETLEGWERIIRTNATGQFLGLQAVIPSMRRSDGGAVVNISSTTGMWGSPFQISYSASKGAVIAMSKSASIALAAEGIRINVVAPGSITTQMTDSDDPRLSRVLARTPMERRGDPREIAQAIVFLASERASYITGAVYNVDGGFMAG